MNNHGKTLDHSEDTVASLLRSVSLLGSSSTFRLQPVLGIRETAIESLQTDKARIDNNNSTTSDTEPCHDHIIEEENLQDFLRWSNQQNLCLLPKLTQDFPLMPTSITLQSVTIEAITDKIATCLQKLQEKKIIFSYRPHPDKPGRIEICSIQCQLKFMIQLWLKEQFHLDIPNAVVVELQRRRGCPIFMHHLRRLLFKALRTLGKNSAITRQEQEGCPYLQRGFDSLDTVKHGHGMGRAASIMCLDQPPSSFPPPLRLNL